MSRGRILIFVPHTGNRRLLVEWLERSHDTIVAENEASLQTAFDLCIADGVSVARHAGALEARKQADHPVFLPILLMSSRQDVGLGTRHLWRTVDELIATPVEKTELRARVETLLRMRRMSQQNVSLRRQLEAELAHAASVQAALLPQTAPPLPGFELTGRCLPAREVGGDFYDWEEISPGKLTLTLGDVSGKGMPAALLMTTTRATLRAVSRQNAPAAALEITEHALAGDLERSGKFITVFHAHLEPAQRRLIYADAGHGHVFVRRRDGNIETLPVRDMPLGAFPGHGYHDGELALAPGDDFVLYSDGLIDASRDREVTPQLLGETIAGAASAREAAERLLETAATRSPLPDDLTVVVLRRRD